MDLKLDIVRTTGRAKAPLSAELGRELGESDLALAELEFGSAPEPISKLRAKHHALARALASGMSQNDAAIVSGYSVSRVSILRSDPAFQELEAFYRRDTVEAYRDMHGMLAALGEDAVAELHERLEAEPDKFSNSMLLEITTKMADRTGYGPASSSTTNVNLNVGVADRMEAARQRRKKIMAQVNGQAVDAEIIE